MTKKNMLQQTALAVGIAAVLAFPAFVYSLDAPHSATAEEPGQAETVVMDKAGTEADRSLNEQIRQSLQAEPALAASEKQIRLETENGEVTLHGVVDTEKEKADISAKVQQISGVKKVDNQLQIIAN
jgi:osmotically-inducible protein OsmY